MKRWARIGAYLLLALGSLELVWVITANRYLKSQHFQELLQQDGLKLSFAEAESYLPGRIHFKDLSLESPETRVKLPEVTLQFSLVALAAKKILFWSASSNGGSLHFKPNQTSAHAKDEKTPASQHDKGSSISNSSSDTWTVLFKKLAFKNLRNLTVGSFAAQGSIDFAAELHLEDQDRVKVRGGQLEVREAQTLWNDQKLARVQNLSGSFELEPMRGQDDWLRKLSFDLTVQAELAQGQALQNFVVGAPWLKIQGLDLKTEGRLVLQQGQLAAPTQLDFQSQDLQLELWKEIVTGHGSFVIAVDEQLKIDFNIPAFKVDHGAKGKVDISGRNLTLKIVTKDRDLQSRDRTWQAALGLPETTVHDLRYFNHFLPQGLGFQFKSGQGQLQLQLDSAKTTGNFIRVQAPGALVLYEGREYFGHIRQDLKIATIDFVQEGFTVPTGELALQIRPGGKDSKEAEWKGLLTLSEARVEVTPSRFEGRVQLHAADLRPLLWVFDPKSKLPDWSRQLFTKDKLQARFHLKADESSYSIDNFKAETADLKLDAWYQGANDKKRGKLFIRYGGLSAGIGVNDDDFKIQLLSSKEWFQNRQ